MHITKTTSCNFKNNFKRILTIMAICAFLAQPLMGSSSSIVSAQPLYAPTPTVSLDVDSQVLIGENFTFTVTFDNSSTDIGYGPYIDVYLPQSGADDSTDGEKEDGITYTSVDYLGNAIRTWDYSCVEGDTITHPLTRPERKLSGCAHWHPIPLYLAIAGDRAALWQFCQRPAQRGGGYRRGPQRLLPIPMLTCPSWPRPVSALVRMRSTTPLPTRPSSARRSALPSRLLC